MSTPKHLLHHVQDFFIDYLSAHRNLSGNTILAYRDTLKLFLSFTARHSEKSPSKLLLDDLTAVKAFAFLDDLENMRHNSIVSRNLRLAALRTFFTYLVTVDPLRAGQYQQVIAIPLKKTSRSVVGYLEVSEVKAVLEAIDRQAASGHRDYTLISLLYNTGARVQEICDLRVKDLRLTNSPLVTLTGKGRKIRHVPLWEETADLVRHLIVERGIAGVPEERLFVNAHGRTLTRFGIRHIIAVRIETAAKQCASLSTKRVSPHTFRHTTAMHLLQSGVDLAVIKSWLGHVNLATTHGYVEIDMEMKRKALAACSSLVQGEELQHLILRNKDVISWLESI